MIQPLTTSTTDRYSGKWPGFTPALTPQHRKSFFDQLNKEKAIAQCYMVAGEVGSVLVMNVTDMEEYTQLADRLFHADKNVAAFTTHMVMSKLK